jgi:RNA polymerase sigma factor (sigma-70 family)
MPPTDLWRTAARRLRPDAAGVPDADLLARFHAGRDEAAFELLLYRHGPLVWAACRRQLSNPQDAEDAFQAAFLALARRPGAIRRGQSVPAWLHRVAVRAGLRRRRAAEPLRSDPIDPRPGPTDQATVADLAATVDVAVNRLPERLRTVVILCELDGLSLKEAAARLGCPVGTVASRLGRARRRLRGLLAGLAPVAVPRPLAGATLRAAAGGPVG